MSRNEAHSTTLLSSENDKLFPEALSLEWRFTHNIAYLIGGLTYTLGSICYFPDLLDETSGAVLFTVGSLAFVFADAFELFKNNHVGCWNYKQYEKSYEDKVGKYIHYPADTCLGGYFRAENGINFALSVTGSFFYLVGSILFFPQLDILDGTIVFIFASLIVVLSQSWKLYRAAYNIEDQTFNLMNFSRDLPAVGIDTGAGLGGLFYAIGSIYFLPAYDISNAVETTAAIWFILGGLAFTASGGFMMYRYFFTRNYPHDE